MGTEVLRPQNCLIERFREPPSTAVAFHRRGTGNGNRKPVVRAEKKKLSKSQNQSEPLISRNVDGGHVMGHVMILRRGQSLDSLNPKIRKESKTASRADKKQPEMSPKQIRVGFSPPDVYAGSAAFSNSPSPRSLPLPSFLKSFDDSATRDLRRLLRLQ